MDLWLVLGTGIGIGTATKNLSIGVALEAALGCTIGAGTQNSGHKK